MRCMPSKPLNAGPLSGQTCCVMVTGERRRRRSSMIAHSIVGDANKQRSISGKDWDKSRDPQTASRAVKEYLATLCLWPIALAHRSRSLFYEFTA